MKTIIKSPSSKNEELENLKESVKTAIESFESEYQNSSYTILSEGDLERLLTNRVADCLPHSYEIHNQISYYGSNNSIKYRVDVVIMKKDDMKPCEGNSKGLVYDKISIAIELKYLKNTDSINRVDNDLKKVEYLSNNKDAYLFIVVLLESDHKNKKKNKFKNKEKEWKEKVYAEINTRFEIKVLNSKKENKNEENTNS